MLTRNALSAAYPLAQLLADKGWALAPIAETPLAQLIGVSISAANTLDGANADQLSAVPDYGSLLLESSQSKDVNGVYTHDQIMESAVAAISNVVLHNLSLARNTVNPQVMKIAQDVQAGIANRSSSALAPMSIVPHSYSQVWDSPVLGDLVRPYAETQPQAVPLKVTGVQPAVALESAVTVGSASFDGDIKAFLDGQDPNYVSGIWNRLFGVDGAKNLNEIITGGRERANDALVAFLLTRRLGDEIPEGVNMDVSAWKAYSAQLMSQSGRAVGNFMKRRETEVKGQVLVFSAPSADELSGDIIVNADVYQRWLADGGTPEILFGAVLTDRRFGYAELLANAERYTKAWKNEYAQLQNKVAFEKYGFLVSALGAAVTALINEIPEDELKVPRATCHALLKEQLTRVKAKHLEDIYGICRKVVCRSVYGYTNAEEILNAIDEQVKAHPELDVREAALLATVDFVSTWVCKLFNVEVQR